MPCAATVSSQRGIGRDIPINKPTISQLYKSLSDFIPRSLAKNFLISTDNYVRCAIHSDSYEHKEFNECKQSYPAQVTLYPLPPPQPYVHVTRSLVTCSS